MKQTQITDRDLIAALRRMAPETGSLLCLGCGRERKCSTHGCAVLRAAVERLEGLTAPPPNPPLTLDELREMDSLDWLWIEILIPTAFRRTKPGYYKMQDDYTDGEALCCGWPGTVFEFEYEDYGRTWLAYRRKPEEGTICSK